VFAQAATGWDIPLELGTRLLNWSARLHEIGLALSHNGYHKHGAYLVDHSDMPGFSSQDQQTLGARMRERALRACLILRLAVLLNRSRGHQPVPELVFTPRKNGYEIGTPEGWLAANPLSRADLEEEVARLRDAGLEVVVR
jgi:exopolyphosphatase/guanosine-5'-triphosphate,3'-diphosphate pyrophosphatase